MERKQLLRILNYICSNMTFAKFTEESHSVVLSPRHPKIYRRIFPAVFSQERTTPLIAGEGCPYGPETCTP
jgi:hypothetical protein